ncbi:hypothetical protein ASC94_09205 [Massilia sp. Root418]|uniref:head-tail joining protein n=1 Tax=Massilia sp. Root418 TaxID=1736532 RepID=UPI0006F95B40|nr:hypothetical protein [Massilia sp. Root418]KQW96974.1 hypothetical protein ASC94_09205 [Massilia sp. Root418]
MIGDDLSPFFVKGDFCGEGDTLGGEPVVGIFDAQYVVDGVGMGMSSTRPAFTLATGSVPAAPAGLILLHAGAAYRVEDHQPDGTGKSVLILEDA